MYFFPTNNCNPATGYGRMELALIDALKRAGEPVHLNQVEAGERALFIGNPKWIQTHGLTSRNWLFTMSESTQVSREWVNLINRYCERVLVPCPALVEIYVNSGVTVPVNYVPLGVDYHAPPFVERDPNPEVFTFLTYSLGDMRKGFDLAMMSFNRLFDKNPRYRMIVKCRDNPAFVEALEDEQIELVTGERPADEWSALLARSNAFVFPSRGEGFGLPPREAVLSGLPTLATEWLGMWDVAAWGYPITVGDMRPANFDVWAANEKGALWAEPSKESLDFQMQRVVKEYPVALERAKGGREYLLKHFSWDGVAELILEMMSR